MCNSGDIGDFCICWNNGKLIESRNYKFAIPKDISIVSDSIVRYTSYSGRGRYDSLEDINSEEIVSVDIKL